MKPCIRLKSDGDYGRGYKVAVFAEDAEREIYPLKSLEFQDKPYSRMHALDDNLAYTVDRQELQDLANTLWHMGIRAQDNLIHELFAEQKQTIKEQQQQISDLVETVREMAKGEPSVEGQAALHKIISETVETIDSVVNGDARPSS